MPHIRKMKLCINRCPIHAKFWSISIDHDCGGTRMTPGKCCGRWETIESWALSARDWQELINEATEAMEQAESVERDEAMEKA